jgi:ferredoxin
VFTRVEPLGVDLDVEEGETIMEAALRHGYRWPTICGGNASCGACCLQVLRGAQYCAPPAARELERLAAIGMLSSGEETRRLACELTVDGPIVVHMPGVRAVVTR